MELVETGAHRVFSVLLRRLLTQPGWAGCGDRGWEEGLKLSREMKYKPSAENLSGVNPTGDKGTQGEGVVGWITTCLRVSDRERAACSWSLGVD
jgi:hypothetical protein